MSMWRIWAGKWLPDVLERTQQLPTRIAGTWHFSAHPKSTKTRCILMGWNQFNIAGAESICVKVDHFTTQTVQFDVGYFVKICGASTVLCLLPSAKTGMISPRQRAGCSSRADHFYRMRWLKGILQRQVTSVHVTPWRARNVDSKPFVLAHRAKRRRFELCQRPLGLYREWAFL